MQAGFVSNDIIFQRVSHSVSAAVPGVFYKPDMMIGSLSLSGFRGVEMHVFINIDNQVYSNNMQCMSDCLQCKCEIKVFACALPKCINNVVFKSCIPVL